MSPTVAENVNVEVALPSARPPRSASRFRYSLLTLFVRMTLACVALAWWVQPRRVVATALFEVAVLEPTLLGDMSTDRFNEREFQLLRNTQLQKIRSHYVLTNAVRQPGIATLPLLASKQDQIGWLQANMEAEFPRDGEILQISLRGDESAQNDLSSIVDAVSKAYADEAIYESKTRKLAERDILAKSLQALTKDLETRMQKLRDLATDLGDKVHDDPEFKLQQFEIDVLTEHLRELHHRLMREEVDANSPARIRQLQPAVVTTD